MWNARWPTTWLGGLALVAEFALAAVLVYAAGPVDLGWGRNSLGEDAWYLYLGRTF